MATRIFGVWALGVAISGVCAGSAAAQPDRLQISGEARARYETLDGQFRAGGNGGDQALFTRILLAAEYDVGPFVIGGEIQDSRAYLDDDGTPLSSSFVNAADLLQGYVRFDQAGSEGGETSVKIGRQTVSIGSKRQIERVSFANVIKSYTGVHAIHTSARGDELHLLGVVPVGRFPNDREEIGDNKTSADEEQWRRKITAIHYRRKDAFPSLASDLWVEGFVYGLHEDDSDSVATPNRKYLQPGLRVFRAPQVGQWDMDLEAVYRTGTRRATSAPADTVDLDVDAGMVLARLGYTFDHPWRPRLALQHYWASGDDDPNDDNFDQYERLFGSRRTDLNNTSLHGPLTPANLSATGVRFDVKPNPRFDARLTYSAASLASDTDAWVIAKLRDPSGQSGDFLGHVIDGRMRYRPDGTRVELELGASAHLYGEFAEDVTGGPEGDATLFGYTQLTWSFD